MRHAIIFAQPPWHDLLAFAYFNPSNSLEDVPEDPPSQGFPSEILSLGCIFPIVQ